MLAALAGHKVAAVDLVDGFEALGAALGVGEQPLDVLRLALALGLPALPHDARARRVRVRRAAEAEADAAGARHLAQRLHLVGGVHADGAAAVRDAGAPLHGAVVIHVRLEEEVVEPLGRRGVPEAQEPLHHGLVADGGALERHALDLFLAKVQRGDEVLRPAVVAEGVTTVHAGDVARREVLVTHLAEHPAS